MVNDVRSIATYKYPATHDRHGRLLCTQYGFHLRQYLFNVARKHGEDTLFELHGPKIRTARLKQLLKLYGYAKRAGYSVGSLHTNGM